jgi:hypothetical protein
MQPGKYFKDGSMRTYVLVEKVNEYQVFGKAFIRNRTDDPRLEWTQIDESQKMWLIDMHTWEPFYGA